MSPYSLLRRVVPKGAMAFLALVAMSFIGYGCQQPTSSGGSTTIVNDKNHPSSPNNAHAVFDIPTPTGGAGSATGHNVHISWTFTPWSPLSSYALQPTPTGPTNGYEFWGQTQLTMVGWQDANTPSWHYEVFRDTIGGNNPVEIGETTNDYYDDLNVNSGIYVYSIQAKSLEGHTPNDKTHHSLVSDGITVTVQDCHYSVHTTGEGEVTTDNTNMTISANKMGKTWPLGVTLYYCDNQILDSTGIYVSINGGTAVLATWQGGGNYHVNLSNPTHKTAGTWPVTFNIGSPTGASAGTWQLTSH